eukprot:498264-Alexandrium_andersonii.AAC.1
MNDAGVDLGVQAKMYRNGTTNLRRFGNLEETKAGVRNVFGTQFEMRPTDSLAMRRNVADVLAAWEA